MKVLCFDVESNGLHGPAFAVAGVLIGSSGTVLSKFSSRCPIEGELDPWVKDNVIGPMLGMPETAPTARAMRDAFWEWYLEAKSKADYIVTANPYPVEARFLMECQRDDMPAREFDHPFPLFDVSSMMAGAGMHSASSRAEIVAAATAGQSGQAHDPAWDALSSGLTAQYLLNIAKKP